MFQIVLNEDQKAAEDAIIKAIEEKERRFRLKGFAGTGKTTLLQLHLLRTTMSSDISLIRMSE